MLHPDYAYTLLVNCFCSPQVGCLFFVLIGLSSAHPIFFELFNKGHLFWKGQQPAVFVEPSSYHAPHHASHHASHPDPHHASHPDPHHASHHAPHHAPSMYPVIHTTPKPQTPSPVYGPPELPVVDITSGSVTSAPVTSMSMTTIRPSEQTEVDVGSFELSEVVDVRVIDFPLPQMN